MPNLRDTGVWRHLMHAARPIAPFLPASVYTHLWFRGPFHADVHGARFKMHHPGTQVENQVFWRNTFERERGSVACILPHLRAAEVMFDVGANTGFFSLLTRAVNRDAKVVALEPSPQNFAVLQSNVEMNAYDIECVCAAATASDGEITLHDFPGMSYSASLEANWLEGTFERRVRAVTLDTLAQERGLLGQRTVLKLDVEGHEPSVLEGAHEVIANRPVILAEILRGYVADGVRKFVRPGDFDYFFVDEIRKTMVTQTAEARAGSEMPPGNYIIVPRAEG